jgi:DNA repair exonuclease SbcCD ATPase subunit
LGEPDVVEAKKADLRTRLDALAKEREAFDARSKVIGDALSYLRAVPTETECPVCEQGISHDHVVVSLSQRIAGEERQQQERILAEKSAATAELESVSDAERELAKLEMARKSAQDEVSSVEAEVKTTIPKPVDDALSALAEEERAIITGLEALKEASARREQSLQAIDSDADRIRAIHKFLKADAEFANIRSRTQTEADSDPGSGLDDELEGLLALEDSLTAISQAISNVARERASGAVESSQEGVSHYYKRLCNHPYFDGIRIEVQDKRVKGVQKNTYTIRAFSTTDGKDSLASSRLSTGQMNCVALSVYLALRDVLTHNLGFVILDDPSQNLDTDHKEALVDLLAELKTSTQLLIASQDEEFQKLLMAKLAGKGTHAYSLAWTPRKGTTLAPYSGGYDD